jgi:pyruvate formate lyase activating enzyme
MKEALLYKKLKDKCVKCLLCPHECKVNPDSKGFCGVRINKEGKLYSLIYERVSAVSADPIEKKPVYHWDPGSLVLSLGSLGCNMRCKHCQNWHISQNYSENEIDNLQILSVSDTIKIARKYNCRGISWTYNEPGIWLEYTLEGAKLAKENGLYTVYVTNGYISEKGLDLIGPYLDVYRVDIKSFSEKFYKKISGIKKFAEILERTKRARQKWNMHVEIVTNVIPGYNDDEGQMKSLALWLKDNLGENTPWHVTRFVPHNKMTDLSPTPVKTLEKIRGWGIKAGLNFVYIGNVPGHKGENTYCPGCQKTVVERAGYNTVVKNLKNGTCQECGFDVKIKK